MAGRHVARAGWGQPTSARRRRVWGRAARVRGGSASKPAMLVLAGAIIAGGLAVEQPWTLLVLRSDASAGTAAELDAGPPDAGCSVTGGTYVLHTEWDHGPRPAGTRATYEMGIAVRGTDPLDVRLSRVAPVAEHLEILTAEVVAGCVLHLWARGENRDYDFRLNTVGSAVTGTFETSRGSSYGGVVRGTLR